MVEEGGRGQRDRMREAAGPERRETRTEGGTEEWVEGEKLRETECVPRNEKGYEVEGGRYMSD